MKKLGEFSWNWLLTQKYANKLDINKKKMVRGLQENKE